MGMRVRVEKYEQGFFLQFLDDPAVVAEGVTIEDAFSNLVEVYSLVTQERAALLQEQYLTKKIDCMVCCQQEKPLVHMK